MNAARRRELEALRRVREADVYKGDVLAARLRRVDAGIEFTYLPEYRDAGGRSVATTLPLTDQPLITTAGAVPPFFAGLLPEGRRLTAVRRAVKTSADDELSLLLAVGNDAVGDVRVLPAGHDATAMVEVAVQLSDAEQLDFSELLSDTGYFDSTAIAGVQDKVSARMISVPVAQAERRFILKLNPPEFPMVVENEHYFVQLAKRAGMTVPDSQLIRDRKGEAALLIERFDRTVDVRGNPVRHAVEDAAQLLGLYPADKYTVSMEAVTLRIAELCAAHAVALRDVYRQVCFAWLTGNGDLHAKNISVMRYGDEWRVTPAYDLPSTLPYGDTSMALSVGGRATGLSRKRLIAFAESIGLATALASRVLDEVLDATASAPADLEHGAVPLDSRRIRDTVRSLNARRRTSLA